MVEIQELFQLSLEQIQLAGFGGRSGLHSGLKLQGFCPGRYLPLQFSRHEFTGPRQLRMVMPNFQGRQINFRMFPSAVDQAQALANN